MLLLAALSFGTAGQEAQDLFGRTIVSVSYTSEGPIETQEILGLVTLRAGEPLKDTDTGSTIRNLFATRRFSDIRIEAEPAGEGVAVTIHLFRAFRVNPLKFEDGVSLSREEMRRAVPFSEGSVFRADLLEEGAAALKRRAAAQGYINTQVFPEVTFDRETFEAQVIYKIEAGEPARVARALFDGETAPFTPQQLLEKARLDPGDRYRESGAQRDAERMRELLHKNGYLEGTVELIAAQPTENGRVMPVYRISVGPKIIFETRGVREKKVRREVHDLIEGQTFDEDLVLQYVENKRRQLQRKGHYRAEVDYKIEKTPGKTTVTITVEEGEKFSVEQIRITGNDSVEKDTLSDLMLTREKGLPLIRPGRLVDQVLEEDVSAILGYYQTHGWVNVEVEEPKISQGSKPDRLVVVIPIAEGPRAIVESRKVVGAEHIAPEKLEEILQVEPGEPFNPNQARQDVYALQNSYRDHGWREAAVDDDWSLSEDQTSAEVVYRVEEGLRTFFGKTIVRGNTLTDTDRITRLTTWDEGDPFSEEEILATQRNLSRTGVFRRVELSPQAADPATQVRNVEIEVQEGRTRSLLYGVGYQYAPDARENQHDPFGLVGYTLNNLFGTMRSAGVELQVATSGRGRFQLSYREPFLFSKEITLTGFLFASREPIQEIDIQRVGFVTEASRYLGSHLRTALRYEYQWIRPVNPEDLTDIERDFRRFDRPIRQSTIGPNAFYDRRDDIIDPHEGYYLTTSAKLAFPLLDAIQNPDDPREARYAKVSGQGVYFQPIGRSVFAVSARGGGIFSHAPRDTSGLRVIPVPIAERFFVGGRSTNRAFETDFLGIPGALGRLDTRDQLTVDYDTRVRKTSDGRPGSCAKSKRFLRENPDPDLENFNCDFGPRIVGGNGFLAFNAELRFPIAGPIGGTIFYDAAQVWPEVSDIQFSLEGDTGLRQGYGIGLRYLSPIGPIRAEYAWPVSPRKIEFDVVERVFNEKGELTDSILRGRGETKETGQFVLTIGYPF